MSAANYDACITAVLKEEGGFSLSRADPGNWTGGKVGVGVLKGTNFGISAAAYPSLDIAHLTVDQAKGIYRSDYWAKVNGDNLPAGVDLAVFDYAVNSGIFRASRALQGVIGETQDGVIGPHTVETLGKQVPTVVVNALCDERLAFLKALPTFKTFGSGWTARVSRIRAQSVAMAGGIAPAVPPIPITPTPKTSASPPAKSFWQSILDFLTNILKGRA